MKETEINQNPIICETENSFAKKECKDIGMIWKRNCPACDQTLFYSNKYGLAKANKLGGKCRKCCNKHEIDTTVYYRLCPKCETRIDYTKKCRFVVAEKRNAKCKKCAATGINVGRIPTEEARKKMASARAGKKHSENTLQKMRGSNNGMYGVYRCGKQNPFYGKKHDEKTKIKMRISALKRVQKNGGLVSVGKNENNYFSLLEETNKWNGIYHGKCGKQFVLWELGYSIDYYEPTLNIVVEYDEPKHYKCGKLREKDVERMNNIKAMLGCRFLRYNEKTGILAEY